MVSICLLLIGCGGYVYQKPDDVSVEKWMRDDEDCFEYANEALRHMSIEEDPELYMERRRQVVEQCMRSHGYERTWTWGMVK